MSKKIVTFKEDTHQYLSDDGELISVSKFVSLFKTPVDWDAKAAKKSKDLWKYEGVSKSKADILQEWDNKRRLGSGAGTLVHEMKEQDMLEFATNIKSTGKKGNGKESASLILEDGYRYPELMIYNFDYMICGQSDVVEVKKSCINITDYKTDKEIKFVGWSSKWKQAERFKAPISHLEECNGIEYSLKMSLYMYLIWKANKGKLKPGKIILKWCPIERDEDGYPILHDGMPRILKEEDIEIPYRKKEVMAMLEHYKTNII